MTIGSDLVALGFKHGDANDVANFQRGWNLGPQLAIDGIAGPNTQHALDLSMQAFHAGKSTASLHFSFSEWRCACGGYYTGCETVRVWRGLLVGLEVYRAKVGVPVIIASGYRCPIHNKNVGGAADSQHMYGGAADVGYALADTVVAGLREFSGIGRSHSTHEVRHMDVRHLTGHNSTNSSVTNPAIWDYAV